MRPLNFIARLGGTFTGFISLAIWVAFVGAALVGPLVWNKSPVDVELDSKLLPPGLSRPLGTDQFGRDIFARFILGARLSLVMGTLVMVSGAAVGTLVGVFAGYFEGALSDALMRLMDSILAFPPLLLAIAIGMAMGGGGVLSSVIGVSLATVPWYARIVRSRVLELRNLEFIEAARSIGGGGAHIIRYHIIPNVIHLVIIQAALTFGSAVLVIAGLSFVGLGIRPPTPEWGVMITEGQKYVLSGEWWVSIPPGVGILLVVTASNLLGDRIRQMLDPLGSA